MLIVGLVGKGSQVFCTQSGFRGENVLGCVLVV